MNQELPHGVQLRDLTPHRDDRGVFTELHRDEWDPSAELVQWNAVHSGTGVLRGVHVHKTHSDYLTIVLGKAVIGLCDLRENSPTHRFATCVDLDAENPRGISIPNGVAHGFYFAEPSLHVYAVSHAFNPADELGCRWDDPDLAIPWPQSKVHMSQRDSDLPSLEQLLATVQF